MPFSNHEELLSVIRIFCILSSLFILLGWIIRRNHFREIGNLMKEIEIRDKIIQNKDMELSILEETIHRQEGMITQLSAVTGKGKSKRTMFDDPIS